LIGLLLWLPFVADHLVRQIPGGRA
jgi:hypothetical protein